MNEVDSGLYDTCEDDDHEIVDWTLTDELVKGVAVESLVILEIGVAAVADERVGLFVGVSRVDEEDELSCDVIPSPELLVLSFIFVVF